jgi:8-oxo-dGTP diphosphatase
MNPTRLLPRFDVAAGVLTGAGGEVLVSQRLPGSHAAGAWEFPGGKIRESETPLEALTRELAEELGIRVERADRLLCLTHDYADRKVVLHVWQIIEYAGTPQGLEGQPLRWVAPENLLELGLLPADRPIVEALISSV